MSKLFLAILLALLGTVCEAKIIAKATAPDKTLLLYDDKCPVALYQKFTVIDNFGKNIFKGCWFTHGTSTILMEEDGEVMILPANVIQITEGA
jgi:hypothetical protein